MKRIYDFISIYNQTVVSQFIGRVRGKEREDKDESNRFVVGAATIVSV